jgi:hypothetical protein
MPNKKLTRGMAQVSKRKQILRANVEGQISEVIRLADSVRVLRGNGLPVAIQVKRLHEGCLTLLEFVAGEEQLAALEDELLGDVR